MKVAPNSGLIGLLQHRSRKEDANPPSSVADGRDAIRATFHGKHFEDLG
ncbi:MAG: hypothetical protein ABSC73_08945 [Acidimicrobiales bacterium]|jgi:hypothetical protein